MRDFDRRRFGTALLALSELYGRALSEGVVGLYWQALDRYSIEAVEAGIRACIVDPDHGQFMPKPADIIRHIDGGKHDAALVAWSKLDAAVQRPGPYASVVFDDPIIMAVVVDMGGWIGFGHKNSDDWPFVAKEFENRYRSYKVRTEPFQHPPVLRGINDLENVRRGYAPAAPAFIGDPAKCLLVYQQGTDAPRVAITVGEIVGETLPRLLDRKASA